ncbi:unnamed protein product [Psylliodes chrysocephalus]|uniref:Phospholipid-transporting ATPase n=1 Tax=Psylliodes chrysocephalus TaxID=3402493 RepID=A0A9P0GKZ7_9CUCU|nr:unnamed protein product [Psylliodes chrysocephala]
MPSEQSLELGYVSSNNTTTTTTATGNQADHSGNPDPQDEVDGNLSSALDRETEISADQRAGAEQRVIFLNRAQPAVSKYCKNNVSTAKYSFHTFIPLFLFEQFRRWANCFFLLMALLQQIPDVSPTGKYTTLVPLIFILTVSAVKEIVEDIKRHRADDEINNRHIEVLREDRWITVKWKKVIVGDIIKVLNNTFFPADLVLLSSSEPQGMSFIETSNLDGETNLKIRQALSSTAAITSTNDLKNLSGTIETEPPNRHLYDFKGVIRHSDRSPEPLGPDQILLRGSLLRNTSWIFGVVIYTGHDTKLMKNSALAPLKRSNVDKMTNTQILLLFGVLFTMCVICCIFNVFWTNQHTKTDWYIGLEDVTQSYFYTFITFLILFNNLVPISLQVTLELVRFIQAIFINMDREMYHAETDTPAMARTSNLNEELGQVKYIFSDKTGTLTRNIMEFKKCAVGRDVYPLTENVDDSLLVSHLRSDHKNAALIREMLVLLSICHTVIPEKSTDSIIYHAASPDERALVYGASKYGYIFESRTPDSVEIDALGKKEKYEILAVLEFTSARKRMSVIVRDPNGKIKLYCKGADSVIFDRLDHSPNAQEYKSLLLAHLEAFASDGLRTLCCAYVDLKESEYQVWKEQFMRACISIQHREEKVEEAANLIERKLKLIGATAIEDKLQEGVPEAIASLLQADISLWVLTGDKQETAINIGYSCRLLSQGMQIIILNDDSLDATRESILRNCEGIGDNLGKQNEIAVIVDGKTLTYALSCELRKDFLRLCVSCKVVICCRASPIQKAEVVEHMRKYTKSITLSIGDGANDVPMIRKAHIGVGISGAEGLQAACASDYSIAQFRFLLRLLLVHGAWNYSRICKVILYSFYKNITLYVIEFWYQIYAGWSGEIIFERWTIALYNVLFTFLPPMAMGLFDKPCSADKMMQYPQLYKPSQNGEMFNIKVFWVWIFNGIFHSALLFWLPLLACQNDVLWMNGRDGGYLMLGNCIYTFVVLTVSLKAGLVMNSWTWMTHCAIWGSIALWFVFVMVYSFFWPTLPFGAVFVGMYLLLFTSGVFWLGIFVVPTFTLLPDFTFKIIHGTVFKTLTDVIRESEIKMSDPEVYRGEAKNSLSETARLLRNVFTRRCTAPRIEQDVELSHGFAFSQEEGGAVSQSAVIRAYNTNIPKPDGM